MLKQDDWVGAEAPEIVMMKIARDMTDWFGRYGGAAGTKFGICKYDRFLEILKSAYALHHDENFQRTAPAHQLLGAWQFSEMTRLCAEGAKPVATYVWVMMVPHIRDRMIESDWLLETVTPMDFSVEDRLFIFGVDEPDDAKLILEKHIPIVRWGIGQVFPSQTGVKIEIWDNGINVWTDEVRAA